jgi:hypothetical protein
MICTSTFHNKNGPLPRNITALTLFCLLKE